MSNTFMLQTSKGGLSFKTKQKDTKVFEQLVQNTDVHLWEPSWLFLQGASLLVIV